MARLRIEFVSLGTGQIIESLLSAAELPVTTTVTASGSRPTAGFSGVLWGHCLLKALDNPIIVAWGTDPTAVAVPTGTPNDGKRLEIGEECAIILRPGDKISAIQVT